MGLRKHVQLANGVRVVYHRVAAIQHVVNRDTMVLVASYTSQAKRNELKGDADADVYVSEEWRALPYDDALTVAGAYAYLKSLPEFEGAEDALEGE